MWRIWFLPGLLGKGDGATVVTSALSKLELGKSLSRLR
jgi:hypothetical protein